MNATGEQIREKVRQKLLRQPGNEEKLQLLELLQEVNRRWVYLARPEQLAPPGNWFIWLILAGRGWGKTRTAAEWVAHEARMTHQGRFALVTATFADDMLILLQGPGELLAIFENHELRIVIGKQISIRALGHGYW